MKKIINIVEDEKDLNELVRSYLEKEGYAVNSFLTFDEAYSHIDDDCDLWILDIMLDDKSGFDLIELIKNRNANIPVVFMSARDKEFYRIIGLEKGSDDYITKPFSAMALLMRVRAIFRRIDFESRKHAAPAPQTVTVGKLKLDEDKRRIWKQDTVLALTPTEYEVLKYLMLRVDQPVSREELLNTVWGFETAVETRATDDTVRRLRQKLDGCGVNIAAVWGFGFRLEESK